MIKNFIKILAHENDQIAAGLKSFLEFINSAWVMDFKNVGFVFDIVV